MTAGTTAGRSRLANNSPSSAYSASPRSPVAALSFTPAPRGKTAASAAAGAPAAAAGSPLGGPRRLSGTFLGQGSPLSPFIFKQQPQQPGFVTPAATSKRRVHTAQTDSKAAAPRPPATAGNGKTGRELGKSLWPLTEDSADSDSVEGSLGSSSLQPGELVTSRRRPKGQAGGAVGKGAAAGCATAPPKAPSSRTFVRQRQQMAQELYAQWNAQVCSVAVTAVLGF